MEGEVKWPPTTSKRLPTTHGGPVAYDGIRGYEVNNTIVCVFGGVKTGRTYLVRFGGRPGDQKVERYGGHQVDEEPSAEIVQRYLAGRRHHLVVLVHVRGPEVDGDVDDKRYVHCANKRTRQKWQTRVQNDDRI